MLDHSSKSVPQLEDPLSEMLRGLRLDGVEYGRCRLADKWAMSFPAQAEARFHFLACGEAMLQAPDGHWRALRAGDAVLLPRGDHHVIGTSTDMAPTPFEQFGR